MIAILGKNSYICNRFKQFVETKGIQTVSVDCRNNTWKSFDFSQVNTVLCPLGIAHVSTNPSMEAQYYAVNRDLPVEIAEYTKSFGVKNFVFFSSMIVYGADKPLGTEFIIDETTDPNPENFYGKSKLDAEQELLKLQDNNFSVAILRIPMVYGPDCKGNFPQLLKVAKKSPFCPNIKNKRSMIYVDNLCEFLRLVIENNKSGIFYPQNSEYVSTVDIIKIAAKYFNHKIIFIRLFNPLIKLLSKRLGVINKIFGTKFYDMSLSPDLEKYNIVDFETSIKECVLAFK